MHKLLAELEEGRWKQRSEFKQYNAVVKKIEKETNKNGSEVGRGFFDKASDVFLQRFRCVFEKHVAACWRSDSILHYLLGGNKTLANEFARWLVDYKDKQDCAAEMQADDDESDSGVYGEEFSFNRFYVDMGTHHYRHQASQGVSIFSDECMEYLTGGAD